MTQCETPNGGLSEDLLMCFHGSPGYGAGPCSFLAEGMGRKEGSMGGSQVPRVADKKGIVWVTWLLGHNKVLSWGTELQ